jgi:hypothetical protein
MILFVIPLKKIPYLILLGILFEFVFAKRNVELYLDEIKSFQNDILTL